MPAMVDPETAPQNLRLLRLSYNSVFENLALEEALARSTTHGGFRPTVRFWVNPPSVVLGRFQRAADEVDTELCERDGIAVGRRFTGGGAVFHDRGNLNLTIANQRKETISPVKLHQSMCGIILDAIKGLGLRPTFLPPNSILVGERKVAGAAAAIGATFVLWHCSLLVSSNLDVLERVLAPGKKAGSTAFVRSQWHEVTNLRNLLGGKISLKRAEAQLVGSVGRILNAELNEGGLSSEEKVLFRQLYETKYSSPDWNLHGSCKET
jgi:lipoate-protein ligase A